MNGQFPLSLSGERSIDDGSGATSARVQHFVPSPDRAVIYAPPAASCAAERRALPCGEV